MKKSVNFIPFILIVLFYFFVYNNDSLSFLIKMFSLAVIILISGYIFWKKIKNNKVNKKAFILFVIFITITVVSFLYSYLCSDRTIEF